MAAQAVRALGYGLTSVLLGVTLDRLGSYAVLYVLLGVSSAVFAFAHSAWLLGLVALLGVLSTDVVESGPFTSLEQAMLAEELAPSSLASGFGVYNAIAAAVVQSVRWPPGCRR
jgi:MFS family permease